MSDFVSIKEVAARDGLQAQSVEITLEQRRELIEALVQTNVPELEIGSFVSPSAVPQMAGTETSWQERFLRGVPNTGTPWYRT